MKVLLAIDHSCNAEKASQLLKELQFSEPVDLTILSVVPPLPAVEAFGTSLPPIAHDVVDEQLIFTKEYLAKACQQFKDRVRSVESVVVTGSPSYEILSIADEREIDHLILGAIGHSMVERIILGSTSDYVATHAKCAVIVARSETKIEAPKRILICLDNSENDIRLLRWMKSIEFSSSTEVHVAHVLETSRYFRQDLIEKTSGLWGTAKDIATTHADVIAKSVARRGFETKIGILEDSHIGERLLKYADDHACDLIVTGDHHRGVLDRMMLGSTSRYVLRHAKCSVAIARSPFDNEHN